MWLLTVLMFLDCVIYLTRGAFSQMTTEAGRSQNHSNKQRWQLCLFSSAAETHSNVSDVLKVVTLRLLLFSLFSTWTVWIFFVSNVKSLDLCSSKQPVLQSNILPLTKHSKHLHNDTHNAPGRAPRIHYCAESRKNSHLLPFKSDCGFFQLSSSF